MEERQKKLLQTKLCALAFAIHNQIEGITNRLWEKELITEFMRQTVLQANPTPLEKAFALIEMLPTRGRRAFEIFFEVCKEYGAWDALPILKPGEDHYPKPKKVFSSPPVIDNNRNTEELDGQGWPTDADNNAYKIPNIAFKRDGAGSSRSPGRCCQRGFLLLVRKSGDKSEDRMPIDFLFQKLKFNSECLHCSTAENLKQTLANTAKSDSIKKCDCLVVILLSHGQDGKFFVEQDGFSTMEEMIEPFLSLKDKPKLFLFQMNEMADTNSGQGNQDRDNLMVATCRRLTKTEGAVSSEEGKTSSLFCRAIYKVFQEHAVKEDLSTLLDKVKGLVESYKGTPDNPVDMTVDRTGSLREKLFFSLDYV